MQVLSLGDKLNYSNRDAEVCVVGRCDFTTGIGLLTYSFAEMWARNFPTCIRPTEPHLRDALDIELPNGRRVPTWQGQTIKASIFVDVFWNGASDKNYLLMPTTGLKLACVVWDSSEFPDEYIRILNANYDAAVTTSPHLRDVLCASGCCLPVVTVPPGLDLEPLMARPFFEPSQKLRIGSISAYHPRKGTDLLLNSFLHMFHDDDNIELLLHSNLVFTKTLDDINRKISAVNSSNVIISTSPLNIDQKNSLLETMDIFVNLSRGEGYSIGVREALALGKVCVVSDVGGHQELAGTPGVFMVPAELRVPARYPEIDNRIFGEQRAALLPDVAATLEKAVAYARSDDCLTTRSDRRQRAFDFSFSKLSTFAASLVDGSLLNFRKNRKKTPEVYLSNDFIRLSNSKLEASGGIRGEFNRVIQMHDGGFFSIFNTFVSHLVWDLKEDRCHRVLPDWDVSRFLTRQDNVPPTSFCYGQASDGNIWTKLFKPLYGLSLDQMQNESFIYQNGCLPETVFNQHREPYLTYIHAYDLYQRSFFQQFRLQYHRVLRDHIELEDDLRREINSFVDTQMRNHVIIGAHVRHPSHTVEQPNKIIAHADLYIQRIYDIAEEQKLKSGAWRVFLATDQDRVVDRFRSEFKDQLCLWPDARRTTVHEDAVFDTLTPEQKNQDGFQLQHLVASSQRDWSINMAREVIRDAYLMSACNTLLHVVSNVSTAVSYLNPRCKMVFCG